MTIKSSDHTGSNSDSTKAIITANEARKILGRDAKHLSNEDLDKIIFSLSKVANGLLDNIGSKK